MPSHGVFRLKEDGQAPSRHDQPTLHVHEILEREKHLHNEARGGGGGGGGEVWRMSDT